MKCLSNDKKVGIKEAGYQKIELQSGFEIYKAITWQELEIQIKNLANFLYPIFTNKHIKNVIQVNPANKNQLKNLLSHSTMI